MELKPPSYIRWGVRWDCFNRTFMELKLATALGFNDVCTVLIGPSWN